MKWNRVEKIVSYLLFYLVISLSLVMTYNQIKSIDFKNFNYGIIIVIILNISIIIYFTIYITKRRIEEKVYEEALKELSYFEFSEEQIEKLKNKIELMKKQSKE